MGKLVRLNTHKGEILVETTDVTTKTGLTQAGGIPKNFDKMMEQVKPICETIIHAFGGLSKKPKSASAEFGLGFQGDVDLFIVKASGEASIKITLNWELE